MIFGQGQGPPYCLANSPPALRLTQHLALVREPLYLLSGEHSAGAGAPRSAGSPVPLLFRTPTPRQHTSEMRGAGAAGSQEPVFLVAVTPAHTDRHEPPAGHELQVPAPPDTLPPDIFPLPASRQKYKNQRSHENSFIILVVFICLSRNWNLQSRTPNAGLAIFCFENWQTPRRILESATFLPFHSKKPGSGEGSGTGLDAEVGLPTRVPTRRQGCWVPASPLPTLTISQAHRVQETHPEIINKKVGKCDYKKNNLY